MPSLLDELTKSNIRGLAKVLGCCIEVLAFAAYTDVRFSGGTLIAVGGRAKSLLCGRAVAAKVLKPSSEVK